MWRDLSDVRKAIGQGEGGQLKSSLNMKPDHVFRTLPPEVQR